jgi:hypothetical protein
MLFGRILDLLLQIKTVDELDRSTLSMLKQSTQDPYQVKTSNKFAFKFFFQQIHYFSPHPLKIFLGGLWRTTDGGASWTPLTDYIASLAVSCIAIDTDGTIYIGTGEGYQNEDAIQGSGIFKSINGNFSQKILW